VGETSFRVFGPMDVPLLRRNGGRVFCRKSVREHLRSACEQEWPGMGLCSKRGCYVFAVRSGGRGARGGAFSPWYVGKAHRQSLLVESTSVDKIVKYQDALTRTSAGTPVLFWIAKSNPGHLKSIDGQVLSEMERFLIAAAHRVNPDLLNCHNKPDFGFKIEGVAIPRRQGVGRPTRQAAAFASMLGV
jgi:hypothetical protein